MEREIKKAIAGQLAYITEEHQNFRDHKILVFIAYDQTGKVIKGSPLQLGKRRQILADLSSDDVIRLGYLAAIEYQDKLRVKQSSLK